MRLVKVPETRIPEGLEIGAVKSGTQQTKRIIKLIRKSMNAVTIVDAGIIILGK